MADTTVAPAHLTVEILDKVIENMKAQGSIPYQDLILHPEIWKTLKKKAEAGKESE